MTGWCQSICRGSEVTLQLLELRARVPPKGGCPCLAESQQTELSNRCDRGGRGTPLKDVPACTQEASHPKAELPRQR